MNRIASIQRRLEDIAGSLHVVELLVERVHAKAKALEDELRSEAASDQTHAPDIRLAEADSQ